jgi:hypothetical protein
MPVRRDRVVEPLSNVFSHAAHSLFISAVRIPQLPHEVKRLVYRFRTQKKTCNLSQDTVKYSKKAPIFGTKGDPS